MITLRERATELEVTWDYRTGWTGDEGLRLQLERLGWADGWTFEPAPDEAQRHIVERARESGEFEVVTDIPSGAPPRPPWTGPGPMPCDW